MARRVKSLHHNLQPGENVVFHREHRSPRNRGPRKVAKLQQFKSKFRRKFKNEVRSGEFIAQIHDQMRKKRRH